KENVILDGELYNHGMDFTDLCSAVKSIKNISDELFRVKYWIFDMVNDDPYERRYELLQNVFSKNDFRYIELIPTILANSHDRIMELLDDYIDKGYEGVMIKKISGDEGKNSKRYKEALYKFGR